MGVRRGGVRQVVTARAGFARPSRPALGNDVPPQTGAFDADPRTGIQDLFPPGPSPRSPGYAIGGQLGANDGQWGADPRAPKLSPDPRVVALGEGQESSWRGFLQGFNDKLRVVDRHAYWDAGHQRTGTTFSPASAAPNTYNNPLEEPPRPDLRTVNRSVTYQKGSDNTRFQDDLSRAYTWLGEQGSGWSPVWGGVPGLYQPYGTRGGVPYPIVDPTNGDGGRKQVWSGPPHGLHSEIFSGTAEVVRRYQVLPQMRAVRVDRPSNSPQAGQSYSQTVQHQGAPPRTRPGQVGAAEFRGRGWGGRII